MSDEKQSGSRRCVWDLTMWYPHSDAAVEEIKKFFRQTCKKWTFQAELGEVQGGSTKGQHYQARISLKIKTTKDVVTHMFPNCRVSLTSTENQKNDFYVSKEESRVDGPWTDKDIEVPRDVVEMRKKVLYGWQQYIVDWCNTYHARQVLVVVDTRGAQGKSSLKRLLMCNAKDGNTVGIIPPIVNTKDLMQAVCSMGERKTYMLDLPRAMEKKHLAAIYAAIEIIKEGWAYDTRYHYKELFMDPPNMVVFTNEEPDLKLLSKDRWNVVWIDHVHTDTGDFAPGPVPPPGGV